MKASYMRLLAIYSISHAILFFSGSCNSPFEEIPPVEPVFIDEKLRISASAINPVVVELIISSRNN